MRLFDTNLFNIFPISAHPRARTMPLDARADIYFHSHESNSPDMDAAGWRVVGVAFDSATLARHFEVRTQQLDIIVNALELLQQKVNHIGPVSQ